MRRKFLCWIPSLVLVLSASAAAQVYQPAESNLRAREWFQEARFGMFITWGPYSVLEDGEWVMHWRKLTVDDYAPLAARFNPIAFDAAGIVSLAKSAGMKYITVTTKHHDGFAMWHTRQTPWNIVDATPYRMDVLRMLAGECRRQGLKLFLYHSHLDWKHPDYYPRGWTGIYSGRPETGDFGLYLDFLDRQLTELLTGYGEIAGVWFDGWWDKPGAGWRLDRTYALVHALQPQALIGNNHHRLPFEGEDFQIWEKDLPGENTAGLSTGAAVGSLPLETTDTINDSWGYNKNDRHYKSTPDLVRYLALAAARNSNFLLNVGPRPDGSIQPEFTERLREVGVWLESNGESIYGTRGGPVAPFDCIVTTQRPGRIYVHLAGDCTSREPRLAGLPEPANIWFLSTGTPVRWTREDDAIVMHLPSRLPDPVQTVIVVDTP